MPASQELKRLVIERAGGRCEYCLIHQDDDPVFRFPVDRIIGGQHGGVYSEENTSLACHNCNQKKGPNIATTLQDNPGTLVPLFHPRNDTWKDHFELQGAIVVGLTPKGKATVKLLDMNSTNKVRLRSLATRNPD
jgi:hypothetical protein